MDKMSTEAVDDIFTKIGEIVVTLPPERLSGFIFRAQVSTQVVGNEDIMSREGMN